MSQLWELTATEAAREVRSGGCKPSELMAACLERIAEREPVVHALSISIPARHGHEPARTTAM